VKVTINMPRLADTMEEGTIVAWVKQVGDHVAKGETLVEIEMEKANMTFESYVEGTLSRVVAPEGATVAIGEPIAEIETPEG